MATCLLLEKNVPRMLVSFTRGFGQRATADLNGDATILTEGENLLNRKTAVVTGEEVTTGGGVEKRTTRCEQRQIWTGMRRSATMDE